jgi:ATP-dependent DNA helicase RecG
MTETQNIEWKESWRDEHLKGICAFANTKGGVLVVGKNDNGKIVGVKNSKKLMEDLPNKISNLLSIVCEVNLLKEDDLEYIEIIVEPSKSAVAFSGKFYKRMGTVSKLLSGQALSDFILKKSNLFWDSLLESKASLNHIDVNAIETFKNGAKKSGRITFSDTDDTESILSKLDLIDENGNYTRASVLLFGNTPTKFTISAFLKIGKFGYSNSELIAQDLIEGNLFEMADKAIELLNAKYILRTVSYEGLQRVETPEYPYEAIREVLFNAIIHREYSTSPITIRIYDDRMEIWNMGNLPDNLTVEKLKLNHGSYPRNPLLAKTFYLGGHIETWGRGTIKIIEECKKHGLPEPVFVNDMEGMTVILYKNRTNPEFLKKLDLNDRQLKAIEYVKKNGFITRATFEEIVDTSYRTAVRDLDSLLKHEVFRKEGSTKSTKYFLY